MLIAIMALFLAAALWGLPGQGFFDPDEGYYLQGGKTVRAAAVWSWQKLTSVDPGGLKEYLAEAGGDVPVGAKHGFYPLVGLGMLLMGITPLAGQAVSVLFGLLGVLAVYHLAGRLELKGAGAAAALMLVLSAIWLCLARSIYTNTAAISLMLWALWLHQQSLTAHDRGLWPAWWAGLLGGWAFTCHYSVLPIVLYMAGVEVLVLGKSWLTGRRPRRAPLALLLLGLGLLVLPVVMQAATWLLQSHLAGAGAVSVSTGRAFTITTYWQQLKIQFEVAGGLNLVDPWFYARYLWAADGALYTAVAGLGIVALGALAVMNRSWWALYYLGLTIGVIAALTVSEVKVSRVAIYLSPLLAIGMGAALAWAYGRSRPMVLVLVLVLVAEGLWGFLPVVRAQSAFPLAVEFLRAQDSPKHLASNHTKSGFYLGHEDTVIAETVDGPQAVRLARARGARWLVLDGGGPYFSSPLVTWLIEENIPAAFAAPEKSPGPFVVENLIYMGKPKPLWANWPFEVRVYDMDDIARRLNQPAE